jgi:hypothetical protein
MITVFLGKLASGKGFETNKLLKQGYEKVSFADALRQATYTTIGFSPKNYDNFKVKLLYLDEAPMWVSKILKRIYPKFQTGREVLQLISDAFKVHDKLIWTNLALKKISNLHSKGKNIVIDDCRFKHELVAIQKFCTESDIKLKIIFCDFRSKQYELYSNHNSEKLAEFIRDGLSFEDGHVFSVDNSFYYTKSKKKYKTACKIYSNSFLEDKDLLDMENLNDFEKLVMFYKGE